jgi:hypothetical protein
MPHRHRDWPRQCLASATSASELAEPLPRLCRDGASSGLPLWHLGELTLCWSFVPDHATKSFHRNIDNQRRRVWSIIHTVVDVYRCQDGTATILPFDCNRRPTVLIGLSSKAI